MLRLVLFRLEFRPIAAEIFQSGPDVMEAAVVTLRCGIGGRVMQLNRQWRQKQAPGRQAGEPDHTAERQRGWRRREVSCALCLFVLSHVVAWLAETGCLCGRPHRPVSALSRAIVARCD